MCHDYFLTLNRNQGLKSLKKSVFDLITDIAASYTVSTRRRRRRVTVESSSFSLLCRCLMLKRRQISRVNNEKHGSHPSSLCHFFTISMFLPISGFSLLFMNDEERGFWMAFSNFLMAFCWLQWRYKNSTRKSCQLSHLCEWLCLPKTLYTNGQLHATRTLSPTDQNLLVSYSLY